MHIKKKKTVENWPHGTLVQHFLQELFWLWHQIRRPHRTICILEDLHEVFWVRMTSNKDNFFFVYPVKKKKNFVNIQLRKKGKNKKKRGCSTNYDISIFEQVMLNLLIIIFVELHQSYLLLCYFVNIINKIGNNFKIFLSKKVFNYQS